MKIEIRSHAGYESFLTFFQFQSFGDSLPNEQRGLFLLSESKNIASSTCTGKERGESEKRERERERERNIEREFEREILREGRFEDWNTLPCRVRVVLNIFSVSMVRGFNAK